MAGCEAPSEGLPGERSQAPWAAHSRYRRGWGAGCVPARASPALTPSPPLSLQGGVSPEHAYRPDHRTWLQPLPTVLMPDPGTLFFRGLCSSSALGPCWAPGLGKQSVCVTHSPGPPLATPLLLGSPAPCSPPGAPKPAAAGGVGERHGLPLLRAGMRGARTGDRRGQGALPPTRGPPFDRVCGPRGKCARGRRPGRHPPSRRGAAARPAPRPPGIPCGGMWLLAGPGGTQLAGGREGRGARRTRAAGVGGAAARGQPRVHARTVARGPQPPPQRRRRHPPRPPQPAPCATCTAPGASAAFCSTSRPGRWLPSHPRRKGVRGLKAEKGLAQGHAD